MRTLAYEGSAIRSIRTTDLLDLLEWSGDYHRRNKYPWSAFVRSTIGVYQLWQGIAWRTAKLANQQRPDLNSFEGFISAGIHFLIVAAALKLPLEQHLPADLVEIQGGYDPEAILFHYSRASQMLFYQMHVKNVVTKRGSSRFNPERLTNDLSELIKHTHIMSERL